MDKDSKEKLSRLWKVRPECHEWWNAGADICPDCKEKRKKIELVATCANCGKPVNECDCKEN
ncbi:hypothetical protein HYT26_03670 [Candidatus Pacearchaeota archaeon]|nr:hypothetical protein [Candidatus Pacearchaeota archaeon]